MKVSNHPDYRWVVRWAAKEALAIGEHPIGHYGSGNTHFSQIKDVRAEKSLWDKAGPKRRRLHAQLKAARASTSGETHQMRRKRAAERALAKLTARLV